MSDNTGIEWADATWNPLVGCTKVSPGCDNCYALGVVNRWHAAGSPAFPATFDTVVMRDLKMLTQPLRWARPRKVFVNSLSDLFHKDVPDEFVAMVFAVMAATPRHTFQLLTKRHGRMRSLLRSQAFVDQVHAAGVVIGRQLPAVTVTPVEDWPLPNVWLGVSVEDQKHADLRIPALLEAPAAIRWISAEPLLGPVDLGKYLDGPCGGECADPTCWGPGLDWVVVGGESGAGARPMHPEWARQIRDACVLRGVPFLFKQWGEWAPGSHPSIRDAAVALTGEWVAPAPALFTVPDPHRDSANRMSWTFVHRAGKKKAGRHLDGRTYDGYPEKEHADA